MRALAAAFIALAGQAAALSCMAPDVAATYLRADAAQGAYVVVNGKIIFDEKRLPATDWENQRDTPTQTPIPAQMVGKSLGPGGFETPFDRAITLNVLCTGPWCAGARSGAAVLAFVERSEAGYTVTLGPCGGDVFAPTPEVLSTVQRCFEGGACAPQTGLLE
ncbi:hypothetical protein KUD11_05655 [Roseovarius sp. LXJ103]|uniref:hypothetical protein n=1 Tax=Roseovarius carneus TaxID=2853164 RepID=UPI000D62212F|nr:hypothetical protein [Roseovarius carneus]MBZ8118128.1 hypothetical protein [Roseovarius carneus]PWE36137.1 hypothetical protein DD563_09315 [Pelagicola sp. LXJ1103]